ncbi:MAG: hypothetical protein KDB03_05530 [Planctomycetales bacterium]|nr:hypothetical protein [Planctomycetales bacterium]
MVAIEPHFLLFCNSFLPDTAARNVGGLGRTAALGRWHFVLERLDGPEKLEAADSEAGINEERLSLLAVVRGLEALEQPSHVTLITTSKYVSRGLRCGLAAWRENNYTWESFGVRRPIRNSDLWQRIDTAQKFHGINCRYLEAATAAQTQAEYSALASKQSPPRSEFSPKVAARQITPPLSSSILGWLNNAGRKMRRRLAGRELVMGT